MKNIFFTIAISVFCLTSQHVKSEPAYGSMWKKDGQKICLYGDDKSANEVDSSELFLNEHKKAGVAG